MKGLLALAGIGTAILASFMTWNRSLRRLVKERTAELEDRLNFESLLTAVSARFVSLPSDHVDDAIKAAQKQICECLGLDASTLWQFFPDHPQDLIMTHVHLPPDFPLKVPEALRAKDNSPWALEMIKQKKPVVFSRVTDAPPAAARDVENWKHFGIKSVMTFPLFVGDGATFGAVSFLMLKESRKWPEDFISRLQFVAQIFANTLNRKYIDNSLRESEMRFKLAADAANAGLWSWDIKTNKIWGSAKARSMYGFSPDEELTGDSFMNVLHPDDRERISRIIEDALRAGSLVQTEYRVMLPDKKIRWIGIRAQAFLKPSGEPDRVTGVSLDITERKQNESERVQLRYELSHLSRVMTMNELSASLAHEINQPLGAILNNASAARLLMSQGKDSHGEISEILSDIVQDARRAGDVIRKIRGIVKKSAVQMEPVQMNALIEDVVMLFNSMIIADKVLVRTDLKPDLSKVMGDRVHLQQVLMNIITNAMEAMKRSSSKILTVRSDITGPDMVTVSVSDTGPGIVAVKEDEVFEPFYTTKKNGLGMGLRICKSIVEDHGGRIWAANNPGGGATFSFSLKAWKGGSA